MKRALKAKREALGQLAYGELSAHSRRRADTGRAAAPANRRRHPRHEHGTGGRGPAGSDPRRAHREGVRLWGARVRKLDVEGLRSQHILRCAVECEAIRQTTARAHDARIDELAALAVELDSAIDASGPPREVQRLNSDFHLRIAKLSGARSLVDTLRSTQLVRILARGSITPHTLKRPRRPHVKLVDAIRTRDADLAELAIREHCTRSMELQLYHMTVQEGE